MTTHHAPDFRLPPTLQAEHYAIALTASPKRKGFAGELTFQGALTTASKTLLLNGRKLKISRAEVRQGRTTLAAKVKILTEQEQICLQLPKELPAGAVTITLRYTGKLSGSMHGLYLAKDGPEVALVSQCEAADARAIFPCLDEPAYKASLQWTVTTDEGLQVITNGKLQRRVAAEDGKVTHKFAKTAPMSTYLAAVTIGAFAEGCKKTVDGVPCRIFAGRNKEAQTKFALEVTEKILRHYVDYFAEPYAYHKLDQVAVPGFDAGAMENSGAIFYRQSLLLYTEGKTSFAAQKRIGEVVAHEIAHQWFGNLVTMQWWDDLWLNEAFATWLAFKSCAELYPDWRIWNDYLESKEAALVADALASTHPIYSDVQSPAQATELFDVITYEKGCGVLRMAESFLGENAFRAGIRRYIKKHRFANARGLDLWNALAEQADLPVAELMQSWVQQSGFPLVHCKTVGAPTDRRIQLRQTSFADAQTAAAAVKGGKKAGKKASKAADQRWLVPIVIAYDAGDGVQHHRVLLREGTTEVVLPGRKNQALRWAYPNHDATGFWRCRLEGKLQAAVLQAGPQALGTAASMALVLDAWALLRAGIIDVAEAMQTFAAFAEARDPTLFRAIAGRIRALSAHVVADKDRPALQRFAKKVAQPHLDRLGWQARKGESVHDASLRAAAVDLLGHVARDAEVLQHAEALQAKEARDPAAVDANLAGSVVVLSALGADADRVDQLLQIYLRRKRTGEAPDVQGRYLAALCAVDKPPAIARVLACLLDGTIPQEQIRSVLGALLGQRAAGPQAWAFLAKNWAKLAPSVGAMGIARLVEATGALPFRLRGELKAFFAAHPVPEAERAVRKADEVMALWQALRRHASTALGAWLRAETAKRRR